MLVRWFRRNFADMPKEVVVALNMGIVFSLLAISALLYFQGTLALVFAVAGFLLLLPVLDWVRPRAFAKFGRD